MDHRILGGRGQMRTRKFLLPAHCDADDAFTKIGKIRLLLLHYLELPCLARWIRLLH